MLSQTPLRRKGPGRLCFSQRLMGPDQRSQARQAMERMLIPLSCEEEPSTNTQKALCWIATSCLNPAGELLGGLCWL